MNNYFSINELLPDEFTEVLTKCKGANIKAIYFKDESCRDVFLSFSNNGKNRELKGVTELRYLNE